MHAHIHTDNKNNSLILKIWTVQIHGNRLWNYTGDKWHRRNLLICLHLEINLPFYVFSNLSSSAYSKILSPPNVAHLKEKNVS